MHIIYIIIYNYYVHAVQDFIGGIACMLKYKHS